MNGKNFFKNLCSMLSPVKISDFYCAYIYCKKHKQKMSDVILITNSEKNIVISTEKNSFKNCQDVIWNF